jgi:UDP-3-O-[3-hydroxymyristoyl] glucosamine N-acyltransferase
MQPMAHRLGELAETLGLSVEGDAALELTGLAGLEDARADELSFATGPRYAKAFAASAAGACIVPPDFESQGRSVLRSRAPYADFARAIPIFEPRAAPAPGVHATAVVASDATLADDVSLAAYVVVGGRAEIGARSRLHPHVTIYPNVVIGADCEIHSGAVVREGVRLGDRVVVQSCAVVGGEGFGFAATAGGKRTRIPHHSAVEVGDDVEIGSNSTIDASHPGEPRRGRSSSRTWIGNGVVIDNGVHVGHGVAVGEGTTLCAHVALGGSTTVGRYVTFGGASAAGNSLDVADGALIGGMTGVVSDVEPGQQVLGFPAVERRLFGRISVAWKKLPELLHRVRRIERQLGIDRE